MLVPTLTEFVVPDSLIRYNYTGYCYDTDYVVYWINDQTRIKNC